MGYLALADEIIEFLIYHWDKPYITLEVLREELISQYPQHVANAVRWIISAWDEEVLAYADGQGTYSIVNLERYLDPPPPGAMNRWRKAYVNG